MPDDVMLRWKGTTNVERGEVAYMSNAAVRLHKLFTHSTVSRVIPEAFSTLSDDQSDLSWSIHEGFNGIDPPQGFFSVHEEYALPYATFEATERSCGSVQM
jgi:hypothetical protein